MTTRRQFLTSTLVAGTGLAWTPAIRAIEPIERVGKPHLRVSLAAYSFHRLLDLKRKPKPAMTLDDFIEFAANHGPDAVELTQYYFPSTAADYLAHLKGKCTRFGLDVSGTAVGNNFCVVDSAKLREQVQMVKDWVDHTSRLGGKTIRIFGGYLEKGDSEDKARERCVAAIQESCDYAAQRGIYLALENHGGITGSADQLLALVKAVRHDWFGVNLDTGNFVSADPYADLEKLAPYAVTVQVKTEIRRDKKTKEEADLARVIGILKAAGYRGYVALEYEAEEDPKVAVPRHVQTLRKLVAG
jgi:sugar phosphate isomerase/epimerase